MRDVYQEFADLYGLHVVCLHGVFTGLVPVGKALKCLNHFLTMDTTIKDRHIISVMSM